MPKEELIQRKDHEFHIKLGDVKSKGLSDLSFQINEKALYVLFLFLNLKDVSELQC